MGSNGDLISRRAFDVELQNLVREYNKSCESDKAAGAFEALYWLRLAPAVDAVEVVRCRDCKYEENCMKQLVFWERDHVLEQNVYQYHNLGFCSYGERKQGDTNG